MNSSAMLLKYYVGLVQVQALRLAQALPLATQGRAVLPLVEGLPLFQQLRGPALALMKHPNQKAMVMWTLECLLLVCKQVPQAHSPPSFQSV